MEDLANKYIRFDWAMKRLLRDKAKNRFQMKIPSFVIEGVFIALRRRLHRPTKVSSQNSGIGCRFRSKKGK